MFCHLTLDDVKTEAVSHGAMVICNTNNETVSDYEVVAPDKYQWKFDGQRKLVFNWESGNDNTFRDKQAALKDVIEQMKVGIETYVKECDSEEHKAIIRAIENHVYNFKNRN